MRIFNDADKLRKCIPNEHDDAWTIEGMSAADMNDETNVKDNL